MSGSDGPTQFCYRQERKVLEKVERLIERFSACNANDANAFFLRRLPLYGAPNHDSVTLATIATMITNELEVA